MFDAFNTYKIQFSDRQVFNKAVEFLSARHTNGFDIGHDDMVIVFFDEGNRNEMVKIFELLGWRGHEKI